MPVAQFAEAIERAKELQRILQESLPNTPVRPITDLANITTEDWDKFKTLVLAGVTTSVAARQAFYMAPQTFKKHLANGDAALPGTVLGQFSLAVRAVESEARAIAEARVFYDNPREWLRGPQGRNLEPQGDDWGSAGTDESGSNASTVVYLHGILTPEKWGELYGTPEARQRTLEASATTSVEVSDGPTKP